MAANAKKAIVPSNYTHPYHTSIEMEEIRINPSRQKFRQYQTKVTKIVDLRNDLVEAEERDNFLTTDVILDDNILRFGGTTTCPHAEGLQFVFSCFGYISLLFRGGSEVIQVKRQYNSPTQIIGEIGGVLKVALMFGMVYTIYNRMKKRLFITNTVFSSKKRMKLMNRDPSSMPRLNFGALMEKSSRSLGGLRLCQRA